MIKQKFLVDFGSKIIIYVITAVIGIIVSRILGPKVIGTVSYGYSYVAMFYFMFGLFGTSHIKMINEGMDYYDCIKVYTIIIVSTLVIFVISITSFLHIQSNYFGIEFSSVEKTVILISGITVGLQGLLKVPDITFTALVQQVKINLPSLIGTFIFNIGRILTIVLGYKAIALATSKFLSILLIIPIYLFLIDKKFFSGKWNRELFKKYMVIGAPLLLITVSISLMSNYSRVYLKNGSSAEELGYFTGAVGLASMLIMIGDTAGSLFFPIFSKAFKNKQLDLIKDQIAKFERVLLIFIFPLVIVLSIHSYTIIPFLLSDKYLLSVPIFSILILYAFVKIWSIPYYNLVNGINKFNLNAGLHVFYALVFFIVLILFVDTDFLNLGALGLACSLLLVEILKLGCWFFFSDKTLNFKFDKNYIFIGLFFIILFISNYFIYNKFFTDLGYPVKITLLFLNIGILYLVMFAFKILLKRDIQDLINLLNIKLLVQYIKEEIKSK